MEIEKLIMWVNPLLPLFIDSSLLQGPHGVKGEKGERVSGSVHYAFPKRKYVHGKTKDKQASR